MKNESRLAETLRKTLIILNENYADEVLKIPPDSGDYKYFDEGKVRASVRFSSRYPSRTEAEYTKKAREENMQQKSVSPLAYQYWADQIMKLKNDLGAGLAGQIGEINGDLVISVTSADLSVIKEFVNRLNEKKAEIGYLEGFNLILSGSKIKSERDPKKGLAKGEARKFSIANDLGKITDDIFVSGDENVQERWLRLSGLIKG
jgi:hypothetical protein